MSGAPLSPFGTARRRFLALTGALEAEAARDLPYPHALIGRSRDRDVGEDLGQLAWELARWPPDLDPERRRALMLLALAVLIAVRSGSTYLPVTGPRAKEALLLVLEEMGVREAERERVTALAEEIAAAGGLSPVIGASPADARPLIALMAQGELRLYPFRLFLAESRLAQALAARIARPAAPSPAIDAAIADVMARPPSVAGRAMTLSAEQRAALAIAAGSSIAVITGGPGTGKTSVVVAILRVLARLGISPGAIALAAPTGKAKSRIEASIRHSLRAIGDPTAEDQALIAQTPPPQTLHRLLGYSPIRDDYAHHENHRLAAEVVIVDEGSMIDLPLIDRLLRATRPDAKLILLGDADQLPSVEVGAVFRDLVPRPGAPPPPIAPPVVRLTQSHRMREDDPAGRAILTGANLINSQDAGALFHSAAWLRRERVDALTFEGLEHLELAGAAARGAFYTRWYEQRIRGLEGIDRLVQQTYRVHRGVLEVEQLEDVGRLLRHLESLRILSLTRGGGRPTGAEAINEAFHLLRIKERGEGGLWRRDSSAFLPGEPVLMERNDYSLDLFNGDFGVVLRAADRDRPWEEKRVVAFLTGPAPVVYPLESLRNDLALAYAMTVHKAQGSEFDQIALFLPDEDLALLTREVLYTAVTRARRSVVVVGSPALIEVAVARRLTRYSGLG